MDHPCLREVIGLHRFFVEWMGGTLPNDEGAFARFRDAIGDGFHIISPEGRTTGRDDLLGFMRKAHSSRAGTDFTIDIRNLSVREIADGIYLVTYEEWQRSRAGVRRWVSSALMQEQEGTPNGVAWLHLQETNLPLD